MSRLFSIIGAASGNKNDLSKVALDTINMCDMLLATERIAKMIDIKNIKICNHDKFAKLAKESSAQHIGILVSGDTGFFSAASNLKNQLSEYGKVEFVCSLSSMQLLCAKCGVSYDDAVFVSLHGRKGNVIGAANYNKKVIVLTGGDNSVQSLCKGLVDAELNDLMVSVGENLGAQKERFIKDTAENISKMTFDELSVMLIENPNAHDYIVPLKDSDLVRGDVPMTKQEVRWTAVDMLEIKPNDIVFDIGAGTGSVAIEMSRHANRGVIYAIERSGEAVKLIDKNRKQLGAMNVLVQKGNALSIIDKLPKPDAVFIGGSGSELENIVSKLRKRNPKIRIVISAISLETLGNAQQALKNFKIKNITQVHAVRSDKNEMNMLNPVYLLYGRNE